MHLQRVHASVPLSTETLTHHIFRANKVGFEYQFIRDTRRSRFALLLEPQILHFKRYIHIYGTPVYIVIKIMLSRSHRPEGEREDWLTGSYQTPNIVGESNHSGSDLEIKVGEGATCTCSASRDGIEKQGGMLRDEGCAEPTLA
jgi:hypothetical protein